MSLKSFFDSMQNSFEEESKKIERRRASSTYRNVVQCDEDYYNKFAQQSDGALLQKYNNPFTSEKDKQTIAGILEGRGYSKHKNGTYGRQ